MPTYAPPITPPDREERVYRGYRLYAERGTYITGGGWTDTWVMVHVAPHGAVVLDVSSPYEGPLESLLDQLERWVDRYEDEHA